MQRRFIRLVAFLALCGVTVLPASLCAQATGAWPRTIADDTGATMIIARKPRLIVSATLPTDEILLSLVSKDRIAAVTAFSEESGALECRPSGDRHSRQAGAAERRSDHHSETRHRVRRGLVRRDGRRSAAKRGHRRVSVQEPGHPDADPGTDYGHRKSGWRGIRGSEVDSNGWTGASLSLRKSLRRSPMIRDFLSWTTIRGAHRWGLDPRGTKLCGSLGSKAP